MNYIRIEGWSVPRALGVTPDGNGLIIQVHGVFCRGCGTCQRRAEQVKVRAAELCIEVAWLDEEATVIVPRPEINESNPLTSREEWLSHFFGSPVQFLHLVPI